MPSHTDTSMSSPSPATHGYPRVTPWLCAISVCALVACGGGSDAASDTRSADAASTPPSGSPPAASVARQQEGARLNTAELEQIAKTGVLPHAFEGPSLSGPETKAGSEGGVAKSAASRVPVYRFFNTRTSAHFFTTSETERTNTEATLPHMTFEGAAFHASSTAIPGLSPVHRFYNTATGVHFYTISEAERAHVAATLPQFSYEGVAYHASTLPGRGYTPLYRFFYASKGFHFYSNSAAERDNIIATLPQYSYEGVGYYVLGSDWQTPAVPHTGITGAQCYQGGGSLFVGACANAGATNLNPQQDGHRAAVNPMSYSSVPSGPGTYHPLTSCVTDNVTGLMWEGKEASALAYRSGEKTYTNLSNSTTNDASTYVVTINAFRVCGFNDWRLPTVEELQGLVDYGRNAGYRINTTAFPNSQGAYYWTANVNPNLSGEAWVVNFYNGAIFKRARTEANHLRLVRGIPWTGQRHLLTTRSYPGDSANNAVLDRKTGLTWRRCQQGRFWNGSTCTGTANSFDIEAALAHAKAQTGWRLPNVKELNSITDYGRYFPALDTTLFPGDNGLNTSSTPWLENTSYTLYVQSIDGYVGFGGGASSFRLVSSSP